ncbi:hypothetical protein V6N13_085272 [Hibiscus sabdariffa]
MNQTLIVLRVDILRGLRCNLPIHVSNDPWEQSIEHRYPPVGNVSEQPLNFPFGNNSFSQPTYNDDGGYIPQFMYPQTSVYGEDKVVDNMSSLLSTTTSSSS